MNKINNDKTYRQLLDGDIEIPYGRFRYPCRLKTNPDATYLSVQLMGDVANRSTAALPIFARWNYGKILGGHVLSICDPTIYLNNNLSLGWYLGDIEENATRGIVAIAQQCAKFLGMTDESIVYSGSSGGGFAAMQAAALMPKGKAVAINAQTDLLKFNQEILGNYVGLATECDTIDTAKQMFEIRWNTIDALRNAHTKGYRPKIVMVNNKNDWHYKAHYIPLASEFGLDFQEEQTINDNFMSILYAGPRAHVAEPSEIVKRIVREGLPFLFDAPVPAPAPAPVPLHQAFSTTVSLNAMELCAEVTIIKDHVYACYLYKDGKVIDKRLYSPGNKFIFQIKEQGEYRCRGFVRNKSNESFACSSRQIHVKV